MRAFICSLFFLGACALRPLVLPAQGTNSFAIAKDAGVGLVADATAWNGHPGDLEDFATPVAIELRNDSGREVRFKLADATLTDDRGRVFRAWQVSGPEQRSQEPTQREPELIEPSPAPPASQPTDSEVSPPPAALKVQTIATEEDFVIVPAVYNPDTDPFLVDARGGRGYFGRGAGPAPTVRPPSPRGPAPTVRPPSYSRPHTGPQVYRPGPRYSPAPRNYGRGYYSPYYYSPWYSYPGSYWGWGWNNYYYGPGYSYGGTLPPRQDDVVRLAMADTLIEPGSSARGFVYFEHATEQASSLTLRVPVRDASNDEVVAELKTVFYVQH